MFQASSDWNLQAQYLIICLLMILFYRVVSFLTVYLSLPRYSYSKSVKQSTENDNIDVLANEEIAIELGDATSNGHIQRGIQHHLMVVNYPMIFQQNKRSCLSYCWLQFF